MAFRSTIDAQYDGVLDPETDRGLILSESFLWLLDEYPEHSFTKQVLRFLDVVLNEPEERALFNLCPRLKYEEKLTALRLPLDEL